MDFLTDWLTNWLKELLIGGIMGNLEGLFDTVNTQVGEIAAQVGTTPAAWHAGVFSLIRQLSETVILPIAGMVLTFVATYELIQMLLEKNNMHEVDVANLYKWMFKTACAILILSNTFNIVMAVFDVSQSVIAQHRAKLHQVPVCRGLSRATDSYMCCNLRGAHSRHRNKRRSHRGDLGNCGLHGFALLHAL